MRILGGGGTSSKRSRSKKKKLGLNGIKNRELTAVLLGKYPDLLTSPPHTSNGLGLQQAQGAGHRLKFYEASLVASDGRVHDPGKICITASEIIFCQADPIAASVAPDVGPERHHQKPGVTLARMGRPLTDLLLRRRTKTGTETNTRSELSEPIEFHPVRATIPRLDVYRWPLQNLRQYGVTDNLLSLVSGRSSQTGHAMLYFVSRHAIAAFDDIKLNLENLANERKCMSGRNSVHNFKSPHPFGSISSAPTPSNRPTRQPLKNALAEYIFSTGWARKSSSASAAPRLPAHLGASQDSDPGLAIDLECEAELSDAPSGSTPRRRRGQLILRSLQGVANRYNRRRYSLQSCGTGTNGNAQSTGANRRRRVVTFRPNNGNSNGSCTFNPGTAENSSGSGSSGTGGTNNFVDCGKSPSHNKASANRFSNTTTVLSAAPHRSYLTGAGRLNEKRLGTLLGTSLATDNELPPPVHDVTSPTRGAGRVAGKAGLVDVDDDNDIFAEILLPPTFQPRSAASMKIGPNPGLEPTSWQQERRRHIFKPRLATPPLRRSSDSDFIPLYENGDKMSNSTAPFVTLPRNMAMSKYRDDITTVPSSNVIISNNARCRTGICLTPTQTLCLASKTGRTDDSHADITTDLSSLGQVPSFTSCPSFALSQSIVVAPSPGNQDHYYLTYHRTPQKSNRVHDDDVEELYQDPCPMPGIESLPEDPEQFSEGPTKDSCPDDEIYYCTNLQDHEGTGSLNYAVVQVSEDNHKEKPLNGESLLSPTGLPIRPPASPSETAPDPQINSQFTATSDDDSKGSISTTLTNTNCVSDTPTRNSNPKRRVSLDRVIIATNALSKFIARKRAGGTFGRAGKIPPTVGPRDPTVDETRDRLSNLSFGSGQLGSQTLSFGSGTGPDYTMLDIKRMNALAIMKGAKI